MKKTFQEHRGLSLFTLTMKRRVLLKLLIGIFLTNFLIGSLHAQVVLPQYTNPANPPEGRTTAWYHSQIEDVPFDGHDYYLLYDEIVGASHGGITINATADIRPSAGFGEVTGSVQGATYSKSGNLECWLKPNFVVTDLGVGPVGNISMQIDFSATFEAATGGGCSLTTASIFGGGNTALASYNDSGLWVAPWVTNLVQTPIAGGYQISGTYQETLSGAEYGVPFGIYEEWVLDVSGGSDPSYLGTASGSFSAEIVGFSVGVAPEPATLSLLAIGGLALLRKRK